jgi:OOP family OmpA-OmpF porin
MPLSLEPLQEDPVAVPNLSEDIPAAAPPPIVTDLSTEIPPASDPQLEAIAQLQTLLFSIDEARLKQLMERLENPESRAIDVAEVLYRAVQQQVEPTRYDNFVAAMMPTVERAIESSVRQHEQVMSEAIFPIVGSAARKAIAAALESTMQALDQVLEQTFSPQALQWKLESLRTGRPFAEVIMLRTLLFRVEQVFLIHRHTGLLLHHCVAPTIAAQDPELVSAMLSAIQDFVQDSFTVESGDMLETLRFGDLTIWIETGPQAILAGVIRGQAPLELRVTFRQAIEQIHRKLGPTMAAFQGDATPFAAAVPDLENCLQTRFKVQPKSKGSPYAWALVSVLLLGISAWGYRDFQIRQRWAAYVQQVDAAPGIVVTAEKKGWRGFSITGLRDPLAIDPATLLPNHRIAPAKVTSQWQPYLSLDPELVEARAKQMLQPPDSVTLQIGQSGVLQVTGVASLQWLEQTRQRVPAIAGVTEFREEVTIAEQQSLRATQQRLEAQVLRFEMGSTELPASQQAALVTMTTDLQTLTQIANLLGKQVRVAVVGRANKFGNEPQNVRLSQQRANGIRSKLLDSGVQVASLRAIGIGTRQPLSDPTIPADDLNRSVTLQISLVDAPGSSP